MQQVEHDDTTSNLQRRQGMKQMQRIRKVGGTVEEREKLLRWFNRYLDKMPDGEQWIEMIEDNRTLQQNKYYHVVLATIAQEVGCTHEQIADHCKAEFLPSREWITLIRRKQVGSSRDLSKDEMAAYIDRIILWASEELGIVIPDIEEYKHYRQ